MKHGQDHVVRIAMILLSSKTSPTPSDVEEAIDHALQIPHDENVSRDAILREIQAQIITSVGQSRELVDNDAGYVDWLPSRRGAINWRFWSRYEQYLEDIKGMPRAVIDSLADLSDSTLRKIEDPQRSGEWDRRGLVVGQVQSGKTGNYTALICRAADAGYKVIIVLAGIHNNLRAQTQFRLDEEFLGFDTKLARAFDQSNRFIGVGKLPRPNQPVAHSLTSSDSSGDFTTATANRIGVQFGSDPILLVIKKNKTVLDRLLKYIRASARSTDAKGNKVVQGIPMLLIDDEADNASINTNPIPRDPDTGEIIEDQDPTVINGLIRSILNSFEKRSYVGYTATPFANIFIFPSEHDIFPRNFIISLEAPSNYIGPVQIFGDQNRLPILNVVDDFEALIPSSHKSSLIISDIPDSLRKAIRAFILSCAARFARGQANQHCSMLIHVTRFKATQKQVYQHVTNELRGLQKRLQDGDGARTPTLISVLRQQWEDEFEKNLSTIQASISDPRLTPLTWSDIEPHLKDAALKINTRLINGEAGDVLDYIDNPKGLSVIAIGGEKLSRGLTLEGLSVSYYLRAAKMYDTLMQMGRWFGYRPGYADLCRVYTSRELVSWYKHITMASEELRQEFNSMADAGATPKEFGLRVQTHPDGMTITAVNKMRHGAKMRVSFAGTLNESYAFHKDIGTRQKNWEVADAFLNSCGMPANDGNRLIWKGIKGVSIAQFLDSFIGHPSSRHKDLPQKLAEYIRKKQAHGEIVEWTVALMSGRGNPTKLGGHEIRMVERSQEPYLPSEGSVYTVTRRHLISGSDEDIDLTQEQVERALKLTIEERRRRFPNKPEPKSPSGSFLRAERPKERGLLLIYPLDPANVSGDKSKPYVGFAASFPKTDFSNEAVEYMVNNVYWEEEFG